MDSQSAGLRWSNGTRQPVNISSKNAPMSVSIARRDAIRQGIDGERTKCKIIHFIKERPVV
jgi:hypothetical protein